MPHVELLGRFGDAAKSAPAGEKDGLHGMLLVLTAIGPASFQIFLPSLPAIQANFGVAAGVAQLALSLSMVGIAFATLAYGRLADRFGRRSVLLAGLALLVVGSLICAAAPGIEMLIVGRIVQAAGGASGMVVGRAIVLDRYGQERSGQVLAGLFAVMMIAPMLATPLGGLLNDTVGWRANFLVIAIVGAATVAMVWLRLPETRPARDPDATAPSSSWSTLFSDYATLLRSRAFAGFTAQGAFAMSAFISFTTATPYVLIVGRGLSATAVGTYFVIVSLGFAAGSLTASRLPLRVGPVPRVLGGSVLAFAAALSALLLTAGSDWPTAALIGPAVVLAFATGITMPASQAGALGAVPSLSGTASGLSGFIATFATAAATQAVGVASDGTARPVTYAMTALSALGIVAAILAVRGLGAEAETR